MEMGEGLSQGLGRTEKTSEQDEISNGSVTNQNIIFEDGYGYQEREASRERRYK